MGPPFGFVPPDAATASARLGSVATVDAFMTSNLRHSGHRGYFVEDVMLVRRLVELPLRRERPDWALVWQALGMPAERTCEALSRALVAVRRALMEYDDALLAAAAGNYRSAGGLASLSHYLGTGRRPPPPAGYVLLLAPPARPERLRLLPAATSRLVDGVTEAVAGRAATGERLRWAWPSADPRADRDRALDHLRRHRSLTDAAGLELDPDRAVAELDALLVPGRRRGA